MKRTLNKVQLGQNQEQEIVKVEGDPAPGPHDGVQGFKALWDFLTTLHGVPSVIRQSVDCPEELKIYHNGKCWIAETRSVLEKDV